MIHYIFHYIQYFPYTSSFLSLLCASVQIFSYWCCSCCLVAKSCLILLPRHGLQPSRLLYPQDFPGKNTGMSCHFLLHGVFPTLSLNLHLLHCRWIHWVTTEALLFPELNIGLLSHFRLNKILIYILLQIAYFIFEFCICRQSFYIFLKFIKVRLSYSIVYT